MDVTERKYQFGTEENQAFMKEIREDLLKFGHQFPSPGGSSYYLGMTELHGKTETAKHGSHAV